jgi:hypothetical protein
MNLISLPCVSTYFSLETGKVKSVLSGDVSLLLVQPGTMQVSGDALAVTSLLACPTPRLGFKPKSFTQHKNLKKKKKKNICEVLQTST